MFTKDKRKKFIDNLYREHFNTMLSMVRKRVGFVTIAEDIVQETFLDALDNVDKLMAHDNPGGWLMEAAKRKTMAVWRRMKTRPETEALEADQELMGIEADFGLTELYTVMDAVLDIHDQTLFHMYYFEGYSAKELAEMEGITEGNFKVRMLRIRNRLKLAIGKED